MSYYPPLKKPQNSKSFDNYINLLTWIYLFLKINELENNIHEVGRRMKREFF
jgi:hypothetical protein